MLRDAVCNRAVRLRVSVRGNHPANGAGVMLAGGHERADDERRAGDCSQAAKPLGNSAKPADPRLRLAKWMAYARSRNAAKHPEIANVEPVAASNRPTRPEARPHPEKGWWKRWTKNLDALEAKLSPGAGKQRKAFRKKQSAKAVLERDARRNQKRGDEPEGDL